MKPARRPPGQDNGSANGKHFSTSGWVTPGIVALLCIGLLSAAYQRGHGNLHRMKTIVSPELPPPPVTLGPGGQDPVQITRSVNAIGKGIEFVSASFLPGRGMNIFQITAMVPGHGQVPLLVSPSVADATGILNGKRDDANGSASMNLGGALMLPWAQHLYGTPAPTPGLLQAPWQDKWLYFPAETEAGNRSTAGLFLNSGADTIRSEVIPDGQYVEAVFHPADFGKDWPSTVEVTVHAELTAHALDITMTAKNTGSAAMPFGMGWHPLFAIPSGKRADAELTIPSQMVFDVNRRTGLPTGKTVSIDGSPQDFSRARGAKLGSIALDETYTNLQMGLLSSAPEAELRDPGYNLMLRVIPMTSNITSLHVIAPPDKPWVSIEPNTNADDPFGQEWGQPEDAGMVTLAPGATMQWKVRLEIKAITASNSYLP
jgi:galactose mutarotase-like enzyme